MIRIELGPLNAGLLRIGTLYFIEQSYLFPSVVIYLQLFYDILYFCSWISVGMGFITLLLFVFLFKEVDVSAKERQYAKDCKRARGK